MATLATTVAMVTTLGPTADRLSHWALAAVAGLLVARAARRPAGPDSRHDSHPEGTGVDVLFRRSSDLVSVVSANGVVRYQSPSIKQTLGWRPAEIEGTSLFDLVHPEDVGAWKRTINGVLSRRPGDTRVQWRARHRDGSWRWLETTIADLTDEPDIGGLVLSGRDVSDRIALEEQLRRSELHDALTGLANRTLFRDRLEDALAASRRRGRTVAVVRFDLDDFGAVNEGSSIEVGDRVLVAVADALRRHVRDGDTVARLDGDEFAVLLDRNDSEADAALTAQRLLSVLDTRVTLDGVPLSIGASAGIATAIGSVDAGELMRDAETAMHVSKKAGKGRCTVFRPEMHAAVLDRLGLERDLRDAVRRQEFDVHYQPIVAMADEEVVGVEALLRWHHPTRGMVAPATFIGLAEETGLIVPIGGWLLRQALQAVEGLTSASGRPLGLSVNLSARQLEEDDLVEDFRQALEAGSFDPARLTLEITESMLLEGADPAIARLHALKALGVRLAIDDFGTGYSSLSYLNRLPVDELKVDRSFVDQLDAGTVDDGLVRTIVALAASFGLETVAEGVERPRQVELLRSMGCHRLQGYLFGRPAPASEIGATSISAGRG